MQGPNSQISWERDTGRMGRESDLIEVDEVGPTRPIASRVGRVSVPPRRLDQGTSATATSKGQKTTVTARKEALKKNESQ